MPSSQDDGFDPASYVPAAYDEMIGSDGEISAAYKTYDGWLKTAPSETLAQRNEQADILFRRMGITFAVYGEQTGVERLIRSLVFWPTPNGKN